MAATFIGLRARMLAGTFHDDVQVSVAGELKLAISPVVHDLTNPGLRNPHHRHPPYDTLNANEQDRAGLRVRLEFRDTDAADDVPKTGLRLRRYTIPARARESISRSRRKREGFTFQPQLWFLGLPPRVCPGPRRDQAALAAPVEPLSSRRRFFTTWAAGCPFNPGDPAFGAAYP